MPMRGREPHGRWLPPVARVSSVGLQVMSGACYPLCAWRPDQCRRICDARRSDSKARLLARGAGDSFVRGPTPNGAAVAFGVRRAAFG